MTYLLHVLPRERLGKRSKDERKEMRIPGVMYGHGVTSTPISVGRSEFIRVFRGAGFSSLIDFVEEGKQAVKVLVKEIQMDPLSTDPHHIDFYQVRMDEELTAVVPLNFVGEASAVKVDGGTLVKSLATIEVRCLPADLPHAIDVPLEKLKTFDDVITVGSITMPPGVSATGESGMIVATVARPLTEDEQKRLEMGTSADVSVIKTEAEEKRAAEEQKKAAEEAAEEKKK